MNRALAIIAALALALVAGTAGQASAQNSPGPVSGLDFAGKAVNLAAPASRIVSLSPGITETLFAIGAGAKVVGVTTYCDYPVEAKALPKVGGFSAKTISVEKIIALKPDLVVSSGGIHLSLEEALVKLGVRVYAYDPADFEGIARGMRSLGALAGSFETADRAAAAMLETISAVEKKLAAAKLGERPAVFWEIYDDPLMTAGRATFQHAILEAGGGRNIFSDAAGTWPRVSAEEVIKRAPAYIMGSDDHGDKLSVAMIASRPGWSQVPAVKSGRIILLPANIVSRPSPRVADGVLAVAKALKPELFR